jgi:hypothetical protein
VFIGLKWMSEVCLRKMKNASYTEDAEVEFRDLTEYKFHVSSSGFYFWSIKALRYNASMLPAEKAKKYTGKLMAIVRE